MNTVDLFRSLLPAFSYDPNGKYLSAELQAEANLMDTVRVSAARALGSITPFYSSMTLSDWERVYELTPRDGATQQERRENVLVKMAATGGLSIPYFTSLAASLGYTITITEPLAFQAGVNRAGDRLFVEGMRWVWQVNVLGNGVPKYRFRAGASAAGEPLLAFGVSILESTFKDLKPAFTDCYFTYEGDE
ncbi:YmfQ family protein [Citrobacter braakii]|uniref:YmfQ family protein n=1 Tax=Citrobacter braakii TaxID=57706 RepID=UPI0024B05C23|nr:putative phage tail protein [Citrobacter braakii]WFX01693.1 DUF2313 domain-containing protein [Citrobacter braakii]